MRRMILGSMVVAVLLATASVQAATTYVADLGQPDSLSAGVSISEWGEAEPITPGTYGGAPVGSARMVLGNAASGDMTSYAVITFPTAIVSADIRHLDGLTDDGFTVRVDGVLWGTYVDNGLSTELWKTTSYAGTPGSTLRIEITGAIWSGRDTYGQLAVDSVQATAVPAPGAILLAGLGTALVGWLRRRRTV